MEDIIKIPISKSKIIWLLIGSLAFVLLGVTMLFIMDVNIYAKIIAVIGILFFGSGLYLFPPKLLDKTPGLIIDKHGITDNITKPKIGIIEWNDISHVEISNRLSVRMLLIFVYNPEKYLHKTDSYKSQSLKNNYAMIGTPFAIPSSILKMKLEDIKILIDTKLIEFHHTNQS